MALFVFDFFYFIKSCDVAATLKFSGKKVLNDCLNFNTSLLRCQTADLSIVMASGAAGGKNVIALGGPYPPHFVGGNAHANAGTADENTPVKLTSDDSLSHLHGDIRVVHRTRFVRPYVDDLLAEAGQQLDDLQPHVYAAVVAPDGNSHRANALFLAGPAAGSPRGIRRSAGGLGLRYNTIYGAGTVPAMTRPHLDSGDPP
jgi:hypothetical protein